MALDTTECPIHKPLDFNIQSKFYSGKAGMHTIKYEIGTELYTGKFIWLHGGRCGSIHDLEIARSSGILQQLSLGEYIMADKAYIGEFQFITAFKNPQTNQEKTFNSIIYSMRIIVENSLNRIKFFTFTQKDWRHKLELHSIAFTALINILNIDIKFRPLRK